MNTTLLSTPNASAPAKVVGIALSILVACAATLSMASGSHIVASDITVLPVGAPALLSEGVDWSRVVAAPVNPGKSVAAYER